MELFIGANDLTLFDFGVVTNLGCQHYLAPIYTKPHCCLQLSVEPPSDWRVSNVGFTGLLI